MYNIKEESLELKDKIKDKIFNLTNIYKILRNMLIKLTLKIIYTVLAQNYKL